MRLVLVGSCSSLLFLVACGVDPTTAAGAAGGLKAAPSQSKTQSRKAGEEQQEYPVIKSAAKKTGEKQERKTRPRADSLEFDGVDGESQDKDHKGSIDVMKIDGVEGESQDKDHKSSARLRFDGVDGESTDDDHKNITGTEPASRIAH